MNSIILTPKVLTIIKSCQTCDQLAACSAWLQNHLYKFFTIDEYYFLQGKLDEMANKVAYY